MKNSLLIIFSLSILAFTSCVSKQSKEYKVISNEELDKIELGSTKEYVESVLGAPREVNMPSERINSEGWIYYGTAGDPPWQRGAVSFDIQSHLVVAKVFIPLEGEKENGIDFLLQKKFSGLKFERVKSQRCYRDYTPVEVFYINTTNGIIIEYNGYQKYVESIIWVSADRANNKLKKIKSCQE